MEENSLVGLVMENVFSCVDFNAFPCFSIVMLHILYCTYCRGIGSCSRVQGYFTFNLCYLVHSNIQKSSGEFTYMFLSRLICLHLQCLSSFSSSSSSSTGTSPAKSNLRTRMSCRIPVRIFQDMVSSWLNFRDIRCMMIRPTSEDQPIGTTIAIMPIRTTWGKQLIIIT